jgi:hypothetical protein
MKRRMLIFFISISSFIGCSVKINLHVTNIDDIQGPKKVVICLEGEYDIDSNFVKLKRKYKAAYNEKGHIVRYVDKYNNKDDFKNSYDNSGRLIRTEYLLNNTLETITKYKYDYKTKEKIEIIYDSNNMMLQGWVYTNKSDRFIKRKKLNADSTVHYVSEFKLYRSGHLKRSSRNFIDSEYNEAAEYVHALFKRQIRINHYECDSLTYYTIENYNKRQNSLTLSFYESNGTLINSEISFFDDNNFMISDKELYPDSSQNYTREYVNDHYGNWITKTTKNKNLISIEYRIIEYY